MMVTVNLFPKTGKSAAQLIGFIAICLAVGGLGSWLTMPSLDPWYAGLVKPSFNPPNWVFGPVWTSLFLAMAYAFWRIWQLPADTPVQYSSRNRVSWIFGVHLLLNIGWSAAFFFMQNPAFGLVVILLFGLSVATVMVLFFKLDKLAGLLFLPYLAWVLFAALLNLFIFLLN